MTRENSKYMLSMYDRWRNSNMDNIFKAYGRPSMKKIEAWEYCEDLCRRYNGHGLKVISRNIYKFTAGFAGETADDDTGELKKIFVFITDCYDRYMEAL